MSLFFFLSCVGRFPATTTSRADDYFFIYFAARLENDRSLSWMGPVMEALSKSYQKYEMGGSSRSHGEKQDWTEIK